MRSVIRLSGVLIGALLLCSVAAAADGQWELIMSKDGIDTYRMTHPGTDVCTFKGVGFVDAKIEVVGEVMRDIPSYPEWMARFKKTTILKMIDRNTFVFNAILDTPFPYQNRDFVIENQTKYNFSNGSALLTFQSAKNFNFPEQKCCFRLNEIEGQYYIEYFGREKTRVSYEYRSSPGGNIPVKLANEIEIKHYPYATLMGMRNMVKKKKYIDAGMASPEHEMIERMLDSKKDVAAILKTRIGEYITDPVLLNMLFELTVPKKIVDNVYATRSDFASIRQGMVDLFDIVGETNPSGQIKQETDGLAAYLSDKRFDSFFNIKKFMGETWLIDEVVKDKKLIYGLFNMQSNLSKVVFEKAATSRNAVTSFIKDKKLAENILTNASLRKKLWEDKVLRDRLANELATYKTPKDFEKLIAERVQSYSM